MKIKIVLVFKQEIIDEYTQVIRQFLSGIEIEQQEQYLVIHQEIDEALLSSLFHMLNFDLGLRVWIIKLVDSKKVFDFIYLQTLGIIPEGIIDARQYIMEYCLLKQASDHNLISELLMDVSLKVQDEQFIIGFYRHQANIAKMARVHFMHRNSVLYQIDRIKRYTGLDIKQFDDLRNLYCYIVCKKIDKNKNM